MKRASICALAIASGVLGAQDETYNHITLSFLSPQYSAWITEPKLVSPAYEANPAGILQVPYMKASVGFCMADFRDGYAVLKAPDGMGVLDGHTMPSVISVRQKEGIESIIGVMNLQGFGASFRYLGEESFGLELALDGERIDLGHFTASVDDTLTAADVDDLTKWLPVTWKLSAHGYAVIKGSGEGGIKTTPFSLGIGGDLGFLRAGAGFTITKYSGALDFTIQAIGDTFSERPTVGVPDTVAWDAETQGRMKLDSILFWHQEMAMEELWVPSFSLGLQRPAGPYRFGVICTYTPGFKIKGSATDTRVFALWLDSVITDVGLDEDYSDLYAYMRNDTLRIDGQALLNFVPDHDLGSMGYSNRKYEIDVPGRALLAFGASREGEAWLMDGAGGWEFLGSDEAYLGLSMGYKFGPWALRTGGLYRFREYEVGDEFYGITSGFLGLTAQVFSGPITYGLSVKTALPEYAFSLLEGTKSVLSGPIRRKTPLLPLTIAFFFSLEAEE
ncbi:MAG: hypothetical protein ABIM46_03605 [candidate division WOR-3 bacterium]